MNQSFKHINHELLRYANCWEDAEILAKGLDVTADDHILSIGSGGDNALFLLSQNPARITAVDINTSQLYLIELKKSAIKVLGHHEFLQFLGFKAASKEIRRAYYERLSGELSTQAHEYWSRHLEMLDSGIIYQGKFEKYFLLFSRFVLPLIHSKRNISKLLANKSADQQLHFYKERWNTWRWRLLFKIFFSQRVMGKFGRDKALFNEVKGSVKDIILNERKKNCQTINAKTIIS